MNYYILGFALTFNFVNVICQSYCYDEKYNLTVCTTLRDANVPLFVENGTDGKFTGLFIVDDVVHSVFGWYTQQYSSNGYNTTGIAFVVDNGDFQHTQFFVGKYNYDKTKIVGSYFYWGNEFGFYGSIDTTENNSTAIKSEINNPNSLNVYPNPVEDILTINIEDESYNSIEIYNLEGKLVIQTPFKNQISVNSLETGPYILKLCLDNNTAKTVRFIKK